jgi:monoamine oxidase
MMVRRRAGLGSIRVYVCREKGGAINAHFPPGVLTTLGHAFRQPVGRIHWAGTETASRWFGFIEGAIRSGERTAEEVLQAG